MQSRKGGAMSARFLKSSENIEKLFIERNNFYVLSMSQLLPYAALNQCHEVKLEGSGSRMKLSLVIRYNLIYTVQFVQGR